jgi:hypothetical protein
MAGELLHDSHFDAVAHPVRDAGVTRPLRSSAREGIGRRAV